MDLVIAVCALLISSLATAASWWQTRVIQQQLSAQVWPYLDFSETLDGDAAQIAFANDGLGPAIVRSLVVSVDGKPSHGYVDVLHALLGPHIVARVPRGERMNAGFSYESPGSVLRAGQSVALFSLTNKHFALALIGAYPRLSFRTCYCAIVPGTCWLADTSSARDPQPVAGCPEIESDLLHASTKFTLDRRF